MKTPIPLNTKASRKLLGAKTGAPGVLQLRQQQAKDAKDKALRAAKPPRSK